MLISKVQTAAAKSLQSCPTLCDPRDGSPPGSIFPGILQARTLEWVAISFSNARKWKVKVKSLSRVWLFATPWTAARRLLCPPLSLIVCLDSCALSQWCCLTVSSFVALSPFAFNLSQHQGLFQWVGSSHQVITLLKTRLPLWLSW